MENQEEYKGENFDTIEGAWDWYSQSVPEVVYSEEELEYLMSEQIMFKEDFESAVCKLIEQASQHSYTEQKWQYYEPDGRIWIDVDKVGMVDASSQGYDVRDKNICHTHVSVNDFINKSFNGYNPIISALAELSDDLINETECCAVISNAYLNSVESTTPTYTQEQMLAFGEAVLKEANLIAGSLVNREVNLLIDISKLLNK